MGISKKVGNKMIKYIISALFKKKYVIVFTFADGSRKTLKCTRHHVPTTADVKTAEDSTKSPKNPLGVRVTGYFMLRLAA